MTDRHNRPILIFSLGIYAFLMGLMALGSYRRPVDGTFGFFMALTVWPLLLCAILGGLAWLAESPLVRRLNDASDALRQGAAAVLFIAGLIAIATGAIAAWCVESTWSYLGFAAVSGACALHQYALLERENLPPEALPLPSARLVQ